MSTTITNPAFVILPGAGQHMNELGHTAIEKVRSADTGGAYYAFEVISPAGMGIPPHVHSREDEVIYVIEGDYEVFLGGKVFRAGPGSVLNFARGTAHGFQNVGRTAGRTVWVVTPGASFEKFFHELAQVPPGPPDLQMIGALFGKYGMDLLPPPGL